MNMQAMTNGAVSFLRMTMVRRTTLLFATCGLLAAFAAARSDEGLWLLTNPPRQQLKEKYAFDLTGSFLERLQKASVLIGEGSGSFVSPDGLVLTNHHVAFEWLEDLSESVQGLLCDGFYADQREKELACPGMHLRVVWSEEDVSPRVHGAIRPDMTLAQASKARDGIVRAIEEESRVKTGLISEVVALHHGGRYHLYRYKTYTDVRLVFAPEKTVGSLLDFCFFRAYEKGKPAKTSHYLAWGAVPPESGDLTLVSGFPGENDRFYTSADLEARYGPQQFLRYKALSRWRNALADFVKTNPEHERHAGFDMMGLDTELEKVVSTLHSQEKLLSRIRDRERAEQLQLMQMEPDTARRRQQALDRIAGCMKDSAERSHAYSFLESGYAFQTSLFGYARHLVRLADESVKPDEERLHEYCRSHRRELKRSVLRPRVIVKEMEIATLTESLDLWASNVGADADLVAQVLDGKSPAERARALVEGTQLDRVEVRAAFMKGGRKAVIESGDAMIALARLVDARSRKIRQEVTERISEPCRQAYAVLTRIREESLGGESYPDATTTLRLSYGKVQPFADVKAEVRLADILNSQAASQLPRQWQGQKPDGAVLVLFGCSADTESGTSGSPVVDRQGHLVGVVAWGDARSTPLAYCGDAGGCGAVAACGIVEVLDNVYHAHALVQELGGNKNAPRKLALSSTPSPFDPPPIQETAGSPLHTPGDPMPATSPSSGVIPATAIIPERDRPSASAGASSKVKANSSVNPLPPPNDLLRPEGESRTTLPPNPFTNAKVAAAVIKAALDLASEAPQAKATPGFSVNPLPPPDAVLRPDAKAAPVPAATAAPSFVNWRNEWTAALVKALKDSDTEVREAAATTLANLGGEAVPALIEALQAKDERRKGRAVVQDKTGSGAGEAEPPSGGQRDVAELLRGLEAEDAQVRRAAARALAAMVRDRPQAADCPPPSRP
jgi:hypothetical protein